MPGADVSPGIQLEYESFGDLESPLLLLVMGFGAQMILWPTSFCEKLAGRGFRVVRFDNRDVGLSTKLLGKPDLRRAMAGDRAAAIYGIEEMADDVMGLLDALRAPKAHLVGASMGGFIVQEAAIRHPQRVLSLASVMSSTGDRTVGEAGPMAIAAVLSPPPADRESAIERGVSLWRTIGSPGFPFDEPGTRARMAEAWDRDHDPAGLARHAAAIATQRDRTSDLSRLRIAALVIHGAADPLIALSGGEATAKAIPDARRLVIPGMAHDLPEPVWPMLIDAIVDNTQRVSA